ncbi:MAG TPA: type II secretion system F family protein [Armatimonadota bacterium]|jgi:type II secretory pathway component PulF|nr:type II secretion system F family protein [Armatimonadota bacterium]
MADLRFHPKLSALVLYTRQFSALIDAGISIMRCFQLLGETTRDPDLKAANSRLSDRVGSGAHLSQAMAERPDLFSPSYIGFVRAGEIGGVLDDAFAYLADWLEQERDLAERLEIRSLLLRLTSKVLGETPASEVAIRATVESAYRAARTASFSRLFEMCLTAGVPMKLALATAAGILEEPDATELRTAAETLAPEEHVAHLLAEIEDLAPVVAKMVGTGEEHACLDDMLRNAARFYAAEAVHLLHTASSG